MDSRIVVTGAELACSRRNSGEKRSTNLLVSLCIYARVIMVIRDRISGLLGKLGSLELGYQGY